MDLDVEDQLARLAARWALSEVLSEDVPEIATQALLQGYDLEQLRRLAGERAPTMADVAELFEEALVVLGAPVPQREVAVGVLVGDMARQITEGDVDPVDGAGRIAYLVDELEEAPEDLLVFSGLQLQYEDFESEVQLDHYGPRRCQEIRDETVARILEEAWRIARRDQKEGD